MGRRSTEPEMWQRAATNYKADPHIQCILMFEIGWFLTPSSSSSFCFSCLITATLTLAMIMEMERLPPHNFLCLCRLLCCSSPELWRCLDHLACGHRVQCDDPNPLAQPSLLNYIPEKSHQNQEQCLFLIAIRDLSISEVAIAMQVTYHKNASAGACRHVCVKLERTWCG